MPTKAYRASSKHGARTASTPRAAALAYFEAFPKARKCNVIEGREDDLFFTVAYGRASEGKWPQSWKDVTRTSVATLPE